eukprot:scaffold273145_cov27-Tisochrysis_lutea.AAC.4
MARPCLYRSNGLQPLGGPGAHTHQAVERCAEQRAIAEAQLQPLPLDVEIGKEKIEGLPVKYNRMFRVAPARHTAIALHVGGDLREDRLRVDRHEHGDAGRLQGAVRRGDIAAGERAHEEAKQTAAVQVVNERVPDLLPRLRYARWRHDWLARAVFDSGDLELAGSLAVGRERHE